MVINRLLWIGAALILSMFWCLRADAASSVGNIVYVSGSAWVEQSGVRDPAAIGGKVFTNDVIVTGARGRVKIHMRDGSRVYVSANSRLALKEFAMKNNSLLTATFNMLWGKTRFLVNKLTNKRARFDVKTSTAVLGVRGTEFAVIVPPPPVIPERPVLENLPPMPTQTVLFSGALFVQSFAGEQGQLLPGNTLHVDVKGGLKTKKTEAGDTNAPQSNMPPAGAPKQEGAEGKSDASKPTEAPADTKPAANTEGGEEPGSTQEEGAPPAAPADVDVPTETPTIPEAAPAPITTDLNNAIQNSGAATEVTLQPNFVLP